MSFPAHCLLHTQGFRSVSGMRTKQPNPEILSERQIPIGFPATAYTERFMAT